jgi:hypothetical protein
MGLFGGKRAAPPSTTRAHATTHGNKEPEDLLSPKSGSTLALPGMNETQKRSPSPLPFDLQAAMEAMQSDTEETAHLVDIVNGTALHLANLINTDDIFASAPKETPSSIRLEDIRTLYTHAVSFANSSANSSLCTAAIRLLAALIATHHPPQLASLGSERALPDTINVRTLYKTIVSSATDSNANAQADAVFVQVGALKALCNNGKDVEGLDGIVGWLIRRLNGISEEYAAFCGNGDEWDGKVRTSISACRLGANVAESKRLRDCYSYH